MNRREVAPMDAKFEILHTYYSPAEHAWELAESADQSFIDSEVARSNGLTWKRRQSQ